MSMILDVVPFAFIVGVGVWAANPGPAQYDDEFTESLRQFLRVVAAGVAIIVILIIWLIVSLRLWTKSTALGERYVGLRVVSARTGTPASMGQMMLREAVCKWGMVLVGVMVVGGIAGNLAANEEDFNSAYVRADAIFLIAFWAVNVVLVLVTPQRQAAWDFLARTTAVRAD